MYRIEESTRFVELAKISELNAIYAHALDHTELSDFAQCFVPEGVLGYADHAIKGHKNLREYVETHRKIPTRHILTSPVYRIADDGLSAKGNSTVVVTLATRQGYRVFFSGHFEDELAKRDDRWLIVRRWTVDSRLPDDPGFAVGPADPDVASALEEIYKSFHRLGGTN